MKANGQKPNESKIYFSNIIVYANYDSELEVNREIHLRLHCLKAIHHVFKENILTCNSSGSHGTVPNLTLLEISYVNPMPH